jgi:hypothetical protein
VADYIGNVGPARIFSLDYNPRGKWLQDRENWILAGKIDVNDPEISQSVHKFDAGEYSAWH